MAKASGGTRKINSVKYKEASINNTIDSLSFPLFGNTSTMAIKTNDVFKQKYQKRGIRKS